MRLRFSGLMAVLAATAVACKGDPTAVGAGTPVALYSDFAAVNVTIGTSATFTSWVADVRLNRLEAPVSFTTCNASIATVAVDTSFHPVPATSMRAVVKSVLPGTSCVKVTSAGVPGTSVAINVVQATPVVITTPTFTSGPPGATLNDTARVVGGFGTLAGTVTFQLYDSTQQKCAASPRYTQVVPIPGTGAYGTSPGFAADSRGIWRWQVVYSGNITNKSVTSACTGSSAELITIDTLSPGGGTGTGSGHGPAPVVLGTAGALTCACSYAILAKTAVANTGTSTITGNIGLSPAFATGITGLALTLDASTQFSTSAQVPSPGKVYAADYGVPTPANLTAAVNNMQTAYTDAAGRTLPDHTELGAGNIGGLTLPAGLYKWSTAVLIPTSVTLSGSANDTWIFQIAQGLTQSSATSVILTGGALAQNVVWQVAGIVTIGTTAHMEGEVLSQTQIVLNTGATANGRLLAQSQVTLDGNTVVAK
jgi:ice-binding like protein